MSLIWYCRYRHTHTSQSICDCHFFLLHYGTLMSHHLKTQELANQAKGGIEIFPFCCSIQGDLNIRNPQIIKSSHFFSTILQNCFPISYLLQAYNDLARFIGMRQRKKNSQRATNGFFMGKEKFEEAMQMQVYETDFVPCLEFT